MDRGGRSARPTDLDWVSLEVRPSHQGWGRLGKSLDGKREGRGRREPDPKGLQAGGSIFEKRMFRPPKCGPSLLKENVQGLSIPFSEFCQFLGAGLVARDLRPGGELFGTALEPLGGVFRCRLRFRYSPACLMPTGFCRRQRRPILCPVRCSYL